MSEYIASAGQTYLPFEKNTKVKTLDYQPLDPPNPRIPELILNEMAIDKGWKLGPQTQHFLPGVDSKMLDWFWANMEKCYYLWAPGSHKRFNWVREPWKYGFVKSAHMISEAVGEGYAVFGGSGITIHRLDLAEYFPFTQALEHVIVEGVFNAKDEFIDMTVHMWEDCQGGCKHITAAVESTSASEPPAFVLEMLASGGPMPIAPSATDHAEYEASRWPVFLPTLYGLWKDHPDPSQNVACDLRVKKLPKGGYAYLADNGPVAF